MKKIIGLASYLFLVSGCAFMCKNTDDIDNANEYEKNVQTYCEKSPTLEFCKNWQDKVSAVKIRAEKLSLEKQEKCLREANDFAAGSFMVVGAGLKGYSQGQNNQGCCSYHNGVCGCSGNRVMCCDGQMSPTCTC